ncbi:SDR family oxidoreductase [Shimia sp. MMG029]|uniref:SDR family oxidoreductase n=1 Tax=Shimia sp. MMG029 TaxID=3021978 RepID=UPI0022FE7B0A|nr:SDR family oxidoreductase [Shimia sp. MMG029]MDA5558041.1 SDR family oxidoreductase [Shimia sp. MMG029]
MRALVTGAGARLGQAMAVYLATRGYDVAVHYASSHTGALETIEGIVKAGRRGVTLQADLLDERQTQALVPQAAEALGGPITCLINNASIFEHDSLETATRESWDRHIESNLRAPFVLSQAMVSQGLRATPDAAGEPVAAGLIVNMLDQRVRKLTPEFASYTIAKMGLWALTQTAAQSAAPHLRVNAIGPGPTLQGSRQSEEDFAQQRARTVLERGANVGDICAALGYLLDAKAVTGQLICVDGGQHLAWQTPDNAVSE